MLLKDNMGLERLIMFHGIISMILINWLEDNLVSHENIAQTGSYTGYQNV